MVISPQHTRTLPHAIFNHQNLVLVTVAPDGTWVLPEGDLLQATGLKLDRQWASAEALLALWPDGGDSMESHFPQGRWVTWEEFRRHRTEVHPDLPEPHLEAVEKEIYRIPYLGKKDNDYIYRFRTERQRNRGVYHLDSSSEALYKSTVCAAIKSLRRVNERRSDAPAALHFGPVEYILPSHFGFCLGVQNAIERAYESLAAHPGKRLFMLSELIHNPFVNEDLRRRGLRYLQTDKGVPCRDEVTGQVYWNSLTPEDIVIIPAFGATNEDKARLVAKGICFQEHDATCMLVEKVWKAARDFGRSGYTVLIHGKSEHEETKATFSNTVPFAPCLVIRDLHEAKLLMAVINETDPREQAQLFARDFAAKASPGFDPGKDLDKLAVVNQTTLLRNETLGIIHYLEESFTTHFGAAECERRLARKSQGDTLCYATQVNQDALERCLESPLDAAIVVGGKNSSNTFQLFRMVEQKLGPTAFYIQSEDNIPDASTILHYAYGSPGKTGQNDQGMIARPFLNDLSDPTPRRILITGGASCPDGLIQQIMEKINNFFPENALRPLAEVLHELEESE